MSATIRRLENRIAGMEKEIQDLKDLLAWKQSEPGWRQMVGIFEGDEVFEEMVEEMRKRREADYAAACAAIDAEEKTEKVRPRRSKKRETR